MGQLIGGAGVQVVVRNTEKTRKTHFIKIGLRGWCNHRNLYLFIHLFIYNGVVYSASGIVVADESDGLQRGKMDPSPRVRRAS